MVAERGEWLGIFGEEEDVMSQAIFRTDGACVLRVGSPVQALQIPWQTNLFVV